MSVLKSCHKTCTILVLFGPASMTAFVEAEPDVERMARCQRQDRMAISRVSVQRYTALVKIETRAHTSVMPGNIVTLYRALKGSC